MSMDIPHEVTRIACLVIRDAISLTGCGLGINLILRAGHRAHAYSRYHGDESSSMWNVKS